MKFKTLHPKKDFLKFFSLLVLVLGTSVGVILATQKTAVNFYSEAGSCAGVGRQCMTRSCCPGLEGKFEGGICRCYGFECKGDIKRCDEDRSKIEECYYGEWRTKTNCYQPGSCTQVPTGSFFCKIVMKDRSFCVDDNTITICFNGVCKTEDCEVGGRCAKTPTGNATCLSPTTKPTTKPTPFSGSCKHTCVPSPECEDGGERVSGTCSYGKICCDYP